MADGGQLRSVGLRRNPGGMFGRMGRQIGSVMWGASLGGGLGTIVGAHRTGKKHSKKSGIKNTKKYESASLAGGAVGGIASMVASHKGIVKSPVLTTPFSVVVGSAAGRKFIEKKAFVGLTPFNIRDKETFHSTEGYMKEVGNRTAGMFAGAAAGALTGGIVGTTLAGQGMGTAAGIMGGGIVGMLTGDYKSVRKGEREAGVRQSTIGEHIGRNIISNIGTSVGTRLAGGSVGALAGVGTDYVVRKKMKEVESGKKIKS